MEVPLNPISAVLSDVVHRSGYLCLLGTQPRQILIHVDGEAFILNVKDGQASVGPPSQPVQLRAERATDKKERVEPICLVECSRSALEAARNSGASVAGVVIKPGPAGKPIPAALERLLRRFFEAPPFPLDDRDDVIYPALFGTNPAPAVFWESQKNVLRILRYGPYLVTSGLSEPWFRKPEMSSSENVSGAGYELLTKSTDPKVAAEFAAWVENIEGGGEDIAPGNWLEFADIQNIPKTETAGFLVIPPLDLAPRFPVGNSHAHWHQLAPISGLELEAAKCYSAFKGEEFGQGKRRAEHREPESKLERSKRTLQLLQALDSLPDTDED